MKRIQMVETLVVDLGNRTEMHLLQGHLYLVEDDVAAQLVAADMAIDEQEPPTCPECLYIATSKRGLAWHMETAHAEPEPEPEVVYPKLETLDPEDPQVKALAVYSEAQLKWIGAQIGVTAADLKPEGENITREEWIAAIIHSGAQVPSKVPQLEKVVSEQAKEVILSTEVAVNSDSDVTAVVNVTDLDKNEYEDDE